MAENPTPHPTTDHPCRRVYREHRRVSNLNPTTINTLLMPDTPTIVGFVGFCEKVWERIPWGDWEEEIGRCGALEVLEAWCEVSTGRTSGPSDVAEERRRPCRARWGHDLSMVRSFGEARSRALFTRVRGRGILRSSYTKTCIAPVSSITDHRRLMYVAILAQLSKHELRHVLPRYSGGFVRVSAEKDLVLTRGTLVSDPGWAYDHPL